MKLLAQELRFASRQLLRTPGFTLVAVLTLGLAIGACTVIYSVVYGIALRPLPYPRPDAIVQLRQINGSGQRDPFSDPNFEDLRAQASSFEAMAEYVPGTTSVIAGSLPLRAVTSAVSHDFFDVVSIYPARGRRFIDEELHENGPRAAILSERFWAEHFGATQDLSAARLRVNGDPYSVVGVMPAGFDFPSGVDILTPREARARNPFRQGQNWQVVARVRSGVALAAARAEATTIARRLKQQYGDTTSMVDVSTIPLQETLVGSVKPLLFVLLTSVVFLLIVACANLASMLLARTSARRREMAVRSALGASGASLILPLVAESLIVAMLGGAMALLLSATGIRAISFIDLGNLPRSAEIRLSWEVLAFATGVTWLTALLLGSIAGWRARRTDLAEGLAEGLKAGERGNTSGRSVALLRRGLVVAQLAVSVVLLIGAGLLGRSLVSLLSQDLGFRKDRLLTIDLSSPPPKIRPTPARLEIDDPSSLPRQAQLTERLLERLRALPGVTEAGGVTRFPMTGGGSAGTFIIARPTDEYRTMQDLLALINQPERTGHADFRIASAGYFRAMGIPLVRGRTFEGQDGIDAPHVAVITESLARSRWPGQDPIGQLIEFGGMDGDLRVFTIVGIVGDVRERGLDAEPLPTLYADYRQRPLNIFNFTVVLQTTVDPALVVADARRVIQDVSPEVPPRFRTVNEVVGTSVANRRLTFLLTTSFAVAAMLVAVLGIYGVLSYLVAQRSQEFGVRMALGAQRSDVQRLVLGEAARLVSIGLAIGVGAALAMGRVLNGLLFEIKPTDPTTYVAVVFLLTLAALAACEVPAIRATRVDPAQALRAE